MFTEDGLPDLDWSVMGPRVGDPFPDIDLPDQRGTIVDLHATRDGHRAQGVFCRSGGW